jgi:predicted dehydrogenase
MDKLKIAVTGLGGISQIMHLPVLMKMTETDVVAVCDKDNSKAKHVAMKHNIKKHYTNIDDMLSDSNEIDAVIIATPTDTHEHLAIKCLDAGKNVLVEKPVARNAKESEKIIHAAEKSGKILMIGMNNRFRTDVIFQRSFIKDNELGEVFYVKTGWLKSQSPDQKWLKERDKSGGGVFIDNGIAMLDLGMWMLGFPEVKSVSAVNYYHNTKSVEDSNFTLIKFKNSTSLTIEVSWSFIRKAEFYYCNVFGKTGSTSINPLRVFKKVGENLLDMTPANIKMPVNLNKSSYESELKNFFGAIKGKNKLISTGNEAHSVMQIVDAIYKSAKAGKEVIFK